MSPVGDPLAPVWRSRLARLCRERSVVLGYHGLAKVRPWHDLSLLQVDPATFRHQIELLLEAGFRFVTVAQLIRLAGGAEPPPGYAAISFDDGMRNNHTVGLPILREHGIAATVYVTIGFIDGSSPWVDSGSGSEMLSEQEVRELAQAGWELGGHTMTHPDLCALGYDAGRREIEEGRDALERIGGAKVETFAYPFGRYDAEATRAVRDSGMIGAVTTASGPWDPYEIPRAMVGGIDPLGVFVIKLTGRYERILDQTAMRALRRTSKQLRGLAQRRGSL